ncbi:MAG: hypothetical protein ACTXOO_02395 [Sodalis sp. (in: enterobacteria)]
MRSAQSGDAFTAWQNRILQELYKNLLLLWLFIAAACQLTDDKQRKKDLRQRPIEARPTRSLKVITFMPCKRQIIFPI